ncbi:SAM-dependent methyltransferase [Micromonospora eburnea]|uniref:SAM-dependent methyltransferase n=1 Tax=Micromonospora eburnea TaxID=227316 RepID=UPI003626E929
MAVPGSLSPRLASIVNALPLQPHSRVLEIGCGHGAAARAVATRLTTGHILAIDRSATAFAQAEAAAVDEIRSGRMSLRRIAAEDFVLQTQEEPYEIIFAVRVGALDGRHPRLVSGCCSVSPGRPRQTLGSSSTAAIRFVSYPFRGPEPNEGARRSM